MRLSVGPPIFLDNKFRISYDTCMSIIFTKTYNQSNIKEIKITNFPVIIFSDSHTNLNNLKRLKELYPNNQFICLGDITFLFSKPGEQYNGNSIDYFIENKIPCLLGNHDQHVLSCSIGNSFTYQKLKFDEYS